MLSIDKALERWSSILGSDRVLNDSKTLSRYSMNTSSMGTTPRAVIYPKSTDEVSNIINIAEEYKVPLYAISGGKNWGYGDACAVSDGQVIVDLSQMNKIIEIDKTMAYVVIEAGVTQKQLSDYLRENDIPLWMDCTGAGPDTTLVGNILERGFGHSPYGNRFQTIAGLEIVLSDGQVLKTGFGHYSHAKTTHLFPYGVGPYLDGLFTQSNLGIVTKLGLWLMPTVECINHFLCFVEKHEDIESVTDSLRPLRLDGTLRSVVHIGNDLRLLSSNHTYPVKLTHGQVPLPKEIRQELRKKGGIGAWNISGAIYGTSAQVAVTRRILCKALKAKGRKLIFLSERKLNFAEHIASIACFLGISQWGNNLRAQIRLGKSLFDMNRGVPNGKFLAGAYWRRQGGLPANFPHNANPALDNCGMLWIAPIIPMQGQDVLKLHDIIEPIFKTYKFDLFITLSTVNDRTLGAVITIAYDKESTDEVQRAQACYHTAFNAVMEAGYVPYRVGIQSMSDLVQETDVYWKTVRNIKTALDPENIIAPGRYDASKHSLTQTKNS